MSGYVSLSHQRQQRARRANPPGFVNFEEIQISSDDEINSGKVSVKQRKGRDTAPGQTTRNGISSEQFPKSMIQLGSSLTPSSSEDSAPQPSQRQSSRSLRQRKGVRARSKALTLAGNLEEDDNNGTEATSEDEAPSSSDASLPFVVSDKHPPTRSQLARLKKRKQGLKTGFPTAGKGRARNRLTASRRSLSSAQGARRSTRTGRAAVDMRERGEDDVWAVENDNGTAGAKAIGAREKFQSLPKDNAFRLMHCRFCSACGDYGSATTKGILVYCQGCSLSYHKACLGWRNAREHAVTKIGDDDFVLQCRQCIGTARRKDVTAPRHDICQDCKQQGPSCAPFSAKKSSKQEEKEREENNGVDPIVVVKKHLINNADNVLFRCLTCSRTFHFSHLPSRSEDTDMANTDVDIAHVRFREYSKDWTCNDCRNVPTKLQTLVGWRPIDLNKYVQGQTTESVNEDDKEYLVKWDKLSYYRTTWMPGAWVWGVAVGATRKAFAKRNNGYNFPSMNAEDVIPEEYLRIDIVLDVRYTSQVSLQTEEIEKARVNEVDEAYVKFKGLGYEEVVWEKVPGPEEVDRWQDFVLAYEDYVLGHYVRLPKQRFLVERIEKAKSFDFQSKVMKRKQPDALVGGELMKYQMDGLNWLLYQWHQSHNAILADEMGLGKTIQIIGFLATLSQDYKCWPFLVVVPNSTCPNWRREIKRWAPSLRVVAYYGSAESRRLAMDYELCPQGSKDLQCHVLVTSYETPIDDSCRRFFKRVPWAGLIVDEGQRLKNDKNLLYEALSGLKIPFKILLTGTPLQNNARELFNLLQFLDDKLVASELEEEYAVLTKDNVPRLHELLQPFFLRRTKAQVLDFLPPLAQIIIPVTMSVLQKKLYKSILARNPQLIKSIFGQQKQKLKQTERSNLNNLLMQLRKCLCHPFVYSRLIEERSTNASVSHRNLVEASSKLQLLEIMLPKLKQRGHRVLIFSQFLEMLDIIEDFLVGLEMVYARLDGSIGALEKQRRIDAFNAPESPLFAFLLSTRAGGVGINLASADTVIILDPDFNPHQDIQALSRAHRIGQKKKVLVFQLMTRDSAEEKVVQIGRKKMALDHVLIEQMDADDDAGMDVESILKHGASALFEDNDERDIKYDSASVDKLLDRSQAEDTKVGKDTSAESQFSYARVWARNRDDLEDNFEDVVVNEEPADPTVWDKILKEREKIAAKEAAARQETLGRGKRRRAAVNYGKQTLEIEGAPTSPGVRLDASSDTDFQAKAAEEEEEEEEEDSLDEEPEEGICPEELVQKKGETKIGGIAALPQRSKQASGFHRAKVPSAASVAHLGPPANGNGVPGPTSTPQGRACPVCRQVHPVGYCPLKLAGPEFCPLCGLAHYGESTTCPHFGSETQIRVMIETMKGSLEPREVKEPAMTYLRGRLGYLVRKKRLEAEKVAARAAGVAAAAGAAVGLLHQPNVPVLPNGTVTKYLPGPVAQTPNGNVPPPNR
ncbi:MAG: hypothetical protein M1833_005139 [Piccolia ochrophora]|nr:MAG: hypothetical protein M1833_005139 [Piccolia ochrophora]